MWRLTKDTACHGNWEFRPQERGRWSIGREAADDGSRKATQLGSGVGQEIAGDRVALVCGAQDDGKQSREIGWRSRVGLLDKFAEGRASLRGDLGSSSDGGADTYGTNLSWRNIGGYADLADRGVESFLGLRFAEANDVAAPGHRGRQHHSFVAEHAAGFSATSVDSEIVGHRASSNTGSV